MKKRRREKGREEEEEKEERYGCYDVAWNLLSFVWIAMLLRILGFLI